MSISLYDLISESIVDGELPQGFSLLSDNANGLMFADGAMDGNNELFRMAQKVHGWGRMGYICEYN